MENNMTKLIDDLARRDSGGLFGTDFLLTWEKSVDELTALLEIAAVLKELRDANVSPKIFDSGLAVSQFRDNSTRTRFSFASACNLLGLTTQDLDEGKSQIAHGETVRETAVMISFMAEVLGIRDDLFIGKGHTYIQEVADAVDQAHTEGVLQKRPMVINLQCDIDHPTQSMADLMHIAYHFGGTDALKGKKIAMSWAYSPSYGKPLSVPQGIIGLMTRFGMDVRLAHPEGYGLLPDVVDRAGTQAAESGGSFSLCGSMDEAFEEADIVYPKSWAPFSVMEERTALVTEGRNDELDALEKRCLRQNLDFVAWECTEKRMAMTNDALYLHCLPADISGVSCEKGEVTGSVFEKFRVPLYNEAGYKPYIIAAMVLASKVQNPAEVLATIREASQLRSI